VSYYAFPPKVVGDYVIGHQKQHQIADEINSLYQKHYAETEKKYLPDTELDVNYRSYKVLEEQGTFVLFTVRKNSTLVGYLQYHVYRDMHAQGALTAREDAFYLLPEHRKGGIGKATLSFAEDCLRQLGCTYVGMTDKSPVGGAPIGDFLKREGYREVAVYYVKELEK
jgi:GNAT superfamily N-acetyltransferase